ncbi:P-loop NTPase fold protein [Lentzea sp. NPDC058450]|uniref:KAP family P-loop NTPase fold protein n=1 Tax=Lentzea sp. NPDC058450 TaxID=3346505 RepID=UPI00365D8F38
MVLNGRRQVEIGTIGGTSTRVAIFAGTSGDAPHPETLAQLQPPAVFVVTEAKPPGSAESEVVVAADLQDNATNVLEWDANRLAHSPWWQLLPDSPYATPGISLVFGVDDVSEAVAARHRFGAPTLVLHGTFVGSSADSSADRPSGVDVAARFAMALAVALSQNSAVAFRLRTMGHGDRVAHTDLLARQAYVESLAELLAHSDLDPDLAGPTVIAIEGAWGSGKSTLMDMTRDRLDAAGAWPEEVADWRQRRVRAWDADLMLRGWFWRPWRKTRVTAPRVLTAVYNPWSAQTGEQVWAGLNDCIVATGAPVIARESSSSLQRFWFQHNTEQLDRSHVQRTLRKRLVSPVLKLAVFALPVPVLIQLLRATTSYRVFGFDLAPHHLVFWVVVALLVAGLAHTAGRYLFRAADTVLPAELFGPSGAMRAYSTAVGTDDPLRDPQRRLRKGQLLSAQEDVHRLIRQLGANKTQLVVFIDDLDRCSPRTTADVFEAINGFLSESFPAIRFVLGIDAAATAAHLDAVYSALVATGAGKDAADPSPGWTFLRKLIQLPLPLPRVARTQVEPLLKGLLGTAPPQPVITEEEVAGLRPVVTMTAQVDVSAAAEVVAREPVIEALEHDVRVQERFAERLKAQPDLSVREAKRIVTVWMFYIRVLDRISPAEGPAAARRAQDLVLLAEIVARWPASQRNLHRRVDGVHGLRALAGAAGDNVLWEVEVAKYELTGDRHKAFRTGVLKILSEYDGQQIAKLAEMLT